MTAVSEDVAAERGFFADRRLDWGLIASAMMHVVGIAVAGIWFSDAHVFDDQQEAIPIEVVTQAEMNQVTMGEKQAPPAPKPAMKVERQAEKVVRPTKPVEEPAERDVPTPPPPPVREAIPEPPPPPQRMALAPEPPPRPAPEPRPEKAEAEPAPLPPRRPEPVKRAEAEEAPAPTPPARPRTIAKAEAKPETQAPRPDQIAKLIEAKRAEEKPQREAKSEAKPDETARPRFSAADIRNAISRERPQQRAAAARETSQTAALGSPTASAERMTPSMWDQLNGYLQEQYRNCWNKFGFDDAAYIPQIRVVYNADGSLQTEPVLVNAPADSAEKALADSALRAVRRCDPMKIPPQYAPYYAQWKARTLRFDPQEM